MEIRGLIPERRVWSDATLYNDLPDEMPPPVPQVPVPAIPFEHSNAFSTPEPKRKAAPAGRSRRKVENPSASPEVISSLIDSFSTFSKSENDYPRLSPRLSGAKSTPATPALRSRASFTHSERNSLTDYEAYRQQLVEEFAEPEAAEPPVVRTSKRPSGKSEWSAPKRPENQSGLGSYLRNAYNRSTSSLSSSHRGDDDARSVGNLSVDSTIRRRSLISISRESLDNRLSTKKTHSKLMTPTKDRFSVADTESMRELVLNATGAPDHLTPPTSPRRRPPFDSTIQEEPPSPKSGPTKISPRKEGKKPMPHDAANGPTVPSRRSSLRHHEMPNAAKNRLSREANAFSLAETLPEDQEEPQSKVILSTLNGEPTEVTKRINDLKARKEQREREARLSPTPEPEYRAPSPQLPQSTTPSPALSQIAFEKETKVTEKKNRIAQLSSISVPARGKSSTRVKDVQNGVPSSIPVNLDIPQRPASPLTPTALPINYSYVVQTLSNRESVPNIKGAASAEGNRRKSLGIGGRSAIGRSAAKKTVPERAMGNGDSRLSSPEPPSGRSSTDTTLKTDKASRPSSLRLKRRRWSLPDTTDPLERKNSMKSDSLAVQPLQRPEKILEERPSSADSIDNDIKKFIHHPRLSQKIRHPLSGRTIAFSEVGDPEGHAVFCCVGMGLTRYVTAFYDELAMTLRLRLITPDRPGVGETPADPNATPLTWPDDVLAICQALHISKFSIMAHSAGAIYALATALRMPQHIRGRVHLLAPWIPPSQMAPIGLTKQDPPPAAQLPKSQRFLRVMPAPFLKIANTGFLSAASASLSPNAASPRRERKKKMALAKEKDKENKDMARSDSKTENRTVSMPNHTRRESIMLMDQQDMPDGSALEYAQSKRDLRSEFQHGQMRDEDILKAAHRRMISMEEENERREVYDSRLTLAIWALATTNANPAVDLIVCLERQRDIGFMYKDITRAVTIHHGSKDTRVPVENVKWLGRTMRKCEVRVLEGEGHGLMASAAVMGGVLEEMGREWKDWDDAVKRGAGGNFSRRRD